MVLALLAQELKNLMKLNMIKRRKIEKEFIVQIEIPK